MRFATRWGPSSQSESTVMTGFRQRLSRVSLLYLRTRNSEWLPTCRTSDLSWLTTRTFSPRACPQRAWQPVRTVEEDKRRGAQLQRRRDGADELGAIWSEHDAVVVYSRCNGRCRRQSSVRIEHPDACSRAIDEIINRPRNSAGARLACEPRVLITTDHGLSSEFRTGSS